MKHLIYTLMSCLLLVAMTACEKDTMPAVFAPKVETGIADNIYRKGATLSGSIQLSEGVKAEKYGILFSNYQSMAEAKEMPVTSGETNFSVQVQDLEPNKTYYFCSYAYGGYSMVRGEVRSFTTSQSNAPVFQTPVVSNTTVNSFNITSELLDDGGSELMLSGFCYNKVGEKTPTFIDLVENVELSGNVITATITGLAPNTSYQIRAYGASGNGLAYSDLVTVTTEVAIVPFLSAVEAVDTTFQSITVMASVLEAGSAKVSEWGFCWSTTNQMPTLSDQTYSIVGNDPAVPFEMELGGIAFNTHYYIRAYAINEYGTGYSEVFTYTPVQADVAYLIDGPTFNERIKQLAIDMSSSRGVYDKDYHIARIKFETKVEAEPKDYVVVSAADSPAPVFASFSPTDSLLTISTSAKDMKIVDASYMFSYLHSLRTIEWGSLEVDETTVNTGYMFYNCFELEGLPGIGNWNTSNVTSMAAMFQGCYKLKTLDVSHWDTSNVKEMNRMFGWCQALHSLDLSRWDVSNVVAMQEMFVECIVMVSLDLSNWKMSQVERLEKMFRDCFALKQLDLSGWTLDGGLDYFEMFLYCNQHFSADNQACEITTTQEVQDFLLNRLEVTGMDPLRFVWTNGNVDNGGSSVDDMPNQEW